MYEKVRGMFKGFKNGLSLRRIHIWLIVIMGILSGAILLASFRLTNTYLRLAHAAEEHAELEKAAHELMDASDYLTERVQRFTINGDMRFLEQYFTEAFESNRREEALARMDVDEKTGAALAQLREAMDHSVNLMNQEYYAMRLVIEAKGYTDYPEILDTVVLSEEDMALSPDEKIRRATELVLNDDYYDQKDNIRRDMQESLEEVDRLMNTVKQEELAVLNRELTFTRIVVIVQVLFVIFMMRLTSILGINPIVRAVDRIREDSPIPEAGANEFRYLAQAYNKMYMKYRSSMEHLNYKASHDELTGAYNRAGYEHLLSHIDLESTYMILLDVDDFKSVNDNYGHDVGDKILIKLVKVLDSVFRDDDCICRIGGDEFVILMVHSSGMQKQLIENKIEQIKKGLSDRKDGLPSVSVSIGVVNGKNATGKDNLFEKTDAAMYESKRKGKNTYTFYT
ncbi:MAG: diguanylate cyclase [Lachnospiraceae bacterium]|nr:diguanylate cyclase [Lachnospiraceae bacterium]MBP1585521.1 diguanylate cyclase [Lachnospiraceae bacterium]